jgi:hypothetical protein
VPVVLIATAVEYVVVGEQLLLVSVQYSSTGLPVVAVATVTLWEPP